jgi:ParD-like antitoxin of type II bacterial toxin-antitoxin system
MADNADRVTRVAADLVDSAAAEGARQSRSAKQQLDHWARVGRAVSSQQTAPRRRVEAALAGKLATSELSMEEGVVFNAEISAAVEESLTRTNYGKILAARGITTAALNEAGDIVERRPDGTSVVLAKRRGPGRGGGRGRASPAAR